jgi:hypothetical protein
VRKSGFIVFVFLSAFLLQGCPRYCDDNELKNGLKNAVVIDISDDGVIKSFYDYGYLTIYLVEADRHMMVEKEKSYAYSLPGDRLPLYHNNPFSTFILKTDTNSDTIKFSAYNPRMVEIFEGCGRSWEIDEPVVEYSTFKSVIKRSFDESKNVLHLVVTVNKTISGE